MKLYVYIILSAICELFSVSAVYSYTEVPTELLRILYIEKTALEEFSFDPFPFLVMLCCLMKIILAVVFITSNIQRKSFVVLRFSSCTGYFLFLIKRQAINTLICSAVFTVAPVLAATVFCGFSNTFYISAVYFIKQFVLLYLSSGISLILRSRLNSGAADISGAIFFAVLIMVDVFADIPAALIDLSKNNYIPTGIETTVCLVCTVLCCVLFKHKKEFI